MSFVFPYEPTRSPAFNKQVRAKVYNVGGEHGIDAVLAPKLPVLTPAHVDSLGTTSIVTLWGNDCVKLWFVGQKNSFRTWRNSDNSAVEMRSNLARNIMAAQWIFEMNVGETLVLAPNLPHFVLSLPTAAAATSADAYCMLVGMSTFLADNEQAIDNALAWHNNYRTGSRIDSMQLIQKHFGADVVNARIEANSRKLTKKRQRDESGQFISTKKVK